MLFRFDLISIYLMLRKHLLLFGFLNQGFWGHWYSIALSQYQTLLIYKKRLLIESHHICHHVTKLNIPEMCHMFHQEIGRSGVSIISKELKPKKRKKRIVSLPQLIPGLFSVGRLPEEEISISKWNSLRNAIFTVIKLSLQPTGLKIGLNTNFFQTFSQLCSRQNQKPRGGSLHPNIQALETTHRI